MNSVYHHVLSDYTGWRFVLPAYTAHLADVHARLAAAFPGGVVVSPNDAEEFPRVIDPSGVSHTDSAEYQTMMSIFSKGAP
jgi:hypothetical protein